MFYPNCTRNHPITYTYTNPAGGDEEHQERYEENVDEDRDVVRRRTKSRSKSAGNIGRIEPKVKHRKDISRRKHTTRDYDD
jgi:hypothetical protein